ncbi:MAG TPA: hypothetical protein VGM76_02275 [Lacipirellulaceae bacterium]|jgi:hypothetical protein
MASVAICPHCYLQLAIPDHAAADAEVECPSCHTEFGLEKATVRAIPEGMVKEQPAPIAVDKRTLDLTSWPARNLPDANTTVEIAGHAGADIASRFGANKTVADVAPLVNKMTRLTETKQESDVRRNEVVAHGDDDEDDAVTNAEDPTLLEEPPAAPAVAPEKPSAAKQSSMTLADWQGISTDQSSLSDNVPELLLPVAIESVQAEENVAEEIELENEAAAAEVPGPSFDLPEVPLTLATGSTVEFGSDQFNEMSAGADFELDDVDLDSPDNRWMKDEFNAAGEAREPAHDPNARTMADVGLLDERLRETSYEESLQNAAEEPAAERYTHSTNRIEADQEPGFHDLPPSLPSRRGGRPKRSALRTMVGAVVGAPVGLAIGYLLFLWWKGPSGDFLQAAKYIPTQLLPSSFVSAAPREESEVASQPQPMAETATELVTKDATNMPASYVTPVKPAAEQSESGEENRYAKQSPSAVAKPEDVTPAIDALHDEPRRFAAPAAVPISGDETHIVGAPLFTISEFAAALAKAQKAEAGLVDGDLSDPAVRKVKGFSYKELCDLAEVVTFCDDSSSAERLDAMRHDAGEVFQKALTAPHTRDEVAQIAAIWIDSTYRKHGGVFLSGAIHGGEIAGDAYEYQLSTEAGRDLTLLLPRPLDAHVAVAGHAVGIVGSIVDDPARKISGYTGSTPRVIWVRDVIPLD